MKLTTEVKIPAFDFEINYSDTLFFIGSCFSNEISKKFKHFGYHLSANPFGTVYNPNAIQHQIEAILRPGYDFEHWIFKNKAEYVSLLHNTAFKHQDKERLITRIIETTEEAKSVLLGAKYVFITLGTANVFVFNQNGKIVANNQKLSADNFSNKALTVEEITQQLTSTLAEIKNVNKDCKIIFTVSPVRHLKDGLVANQVSKAKLLLAVNQILNQADVYYFPSYEIVLDELRDYRFFADDLAHVNSLGVNYIWEKLKEALLNQKEAKIREAVSQLRKLQLHKVVDKSKLENHNSLIQEKKEAIEKQFKIMIDK